MEIINPETKEIETKALTITEQATVLTISNNQEYAVASDLLKTIASLKKMIISLKDHLHKIKSDYFDLSYF